MKDGYYWVKAKYENAKWVIAIVVIKGAFVCINGSSRDSANYEIGDYIETPDKYKE